MISTVFIVDCPRLVGTKLFQAGPDDSCYLGIIIRRNASYVEGCFHWSKIRENSVCGDGAVLGLWTKVVMDMDGKIKKDKLGRLNIDL